MLFSQTFAITFPKNETRRGILDQMANLASGLILFKGPRTKFQDALPMRLLQNAR
jgi:hypothetical protein